MMMSAAYYRSQAERARRIASEIGREDVKRNFADLARDYDELAEDLEAGAMVIRHPELVEQRRR